MRVAPRAGRDALESAVAEHGQRRQGRGHALTAHGQRLAAPRVVHERDTFSAQGVRGRRLHHGRGEARGDGGVERVAAREQHAHPRHRHERMPRRDHALGARDHGPAGGPVRRVMLHLVDSW